MENREPKGRVVLAKYGLFTSMHPWRRDGVPRGGIEGSYRKIAWRGGSENG
jgi:hypothetical protein